MNPILDYVRNIVVNVIKIKVDQVYNGIVLAGGLYLLIDDTIMLIFDLSNKIPPEVKLTFNRESLIEDRVECNPIIFKDIENKVHYYASFSNEINAYASIITEVPATRSGLRPTRSINTMETNVIRTMKIPTRFDWTKESEPLNPPISKSFGA